MVTSWPNSIKTVLICYTWFDSLPNPPDLPILPPLINKLYFKESSILKLLPFFSYIICKLTTSICISDHISKSQRSQTIWCFVSRTLQSTCFCHSGIFRFSRDCWYRCSCSTHSTTQMATKYTRWTRNTVLISTCKGYCKFQWWKFHAYVQRTSRFGLRGMAISPGSCLSSTGTYKLFNSFHHVWQWNYHG